MGNGILLPQIKDLMKNLSKISYPIILFLSFLILGISPVFAQEKINLRLQDAEQQIASFGATYRYGDQKGISDL